MWKERVTFLFLILSREVYDREIFHTKKKVHNFNTHGQIYFERQFKGVVLYNDTWEAGSLSAGRDIPRISSSLEFHYRVERRLQ